MKEYQNIIIRMPNWIGDMVMATPVIADVRTRFPKASITVMALKNLSPVLFGNPHINEIFAFTKQNELMYREENRDLILRLRQGKYDLGILLTNSFSSAVMFWKGEIKERVGFKKDFRSLFLTKKIKPLKTKGEEHLVKTYKRLLAPFQIPISDTSPELFVTTEEKKAVQELLKEYQIPKNHKIVGINPLAAYGEAKCWPADRFRELAIQLSHEKNITVIFFGDKSGREIIQGICNGLGSQVINLSGLTTLRELIAFISICDLFVTNDSGPMHIAAALKTPLIALFGSTSEIATGPYQHGKIIHKHVACSPCYLRKCPIDFRCMKQIEVNEVMNEIKMSLEQTGK